VIVVKVEVNVQVKIENDVTSLLVIVYGASVKVVKVLRRKLERVLGE
jgi:hypothetical protein